MRSGYNPTRRNRNIGTSAQGHGRDNRFSIPRICQEERTWWEQVRNYQFVQHDVHGKTISFILEETDPGFIHACSIRDILTVIGALPAEDLKGMETVVLRQSTRKQRIMSPCWGRMAYFAEIGRAGKRDSRTGPAIFLEAIDPGRSLTWNKSLGCDALREMERLVSDGHVLHDRGKYWEFESPEPAIRETQLYRTLLHEIGHWVDWLDKVVRPAGGDFETEVTLSDKFFARPSTEREMFADHYAILAAARLEEREIIPFPRRP